ncbi:hypothetical protein NQ317_016537 [Molorchus minor]|uniref:Chitin-binding type-4 domain-containing protein n=1 Tax=Molorchus minor TaxID=1323400 RepID=A0ABQ9IX16_9CUCU|nr:hypothetical protein NQ317_016537 [Molorchus minor]
MSEVHHSINGGRCGVCGDPYSEPHPRAHENTGTYGKGVFVAIYQPGSIVEIIIRLTANHLGHFTYSLCVLEDPSAPESGEDCFIPLTLKDGSKQYSVTSTDFYVTNYVKLPEITCEHCVLRWTYTAGNSWGQCLDGTHAVGCGPQETFRSCADVAIL